MADELRESGRDLLDTAKKRQEDRYLLTLCGARMLTAGNEFERLLRHVAEYLTRMEDDGK